MIRSIQTNSSDSARRAGFQKAALTLGILGGSLLASCGGGGGGGPIAPPVTAPQQLSYQAGVALSRAGSAINVAAPAVVGDVATWSVSPALPAGVALSALDGSISGVPTEAVGRVRYLVTASNSGGSTDATVVLSVPQPVRFALVTHQSEGTFGRFFVDDPSGNLVHRGYVVQDENEIAPEGLVATPDGRFAFTTNSGSNDLSSYTIDSNSGALAPLETLALPAGDYSIAVHPSGASLHIAARGSSRLESFSIDAVSGLLTQIGTSLVTASQPSDIDISPDGGYLLLTHKSQSQIDSYALDPVTQVPSYSSSFDLAPGSPQTAGLAISPFGDYVYAVFKNLNLAGHFSADPVTGTLTLVGTGLPVGPDVGPSAVTVHPGGQHVYFLNEASESLTRYSVELATGALTRQESLALPRVARDFTIEPGGRYGYLVDDAEHTCTRVDLDPVTGVASLAASVRTRRIPGTVTLVSGPSSLRVVARNLYVANADSDDVSVNAVAADGTLIPLLPTAPAGDLPGNLTADPLGRFAYVSNFSDATISRYALGVDGKLTELSPPQACDPDPGALTVDPSGRFLYVITRGNEGLQAFSIAADGSLALIEARASGTRGTAIAVDPSGQYLYIAIQGDRTPGNVGRIDSYGIDPRTGMLDPRSPAGQAPGGPTSLGLAPDGKMIYTTLSHANHLAPYDISGEFGTLTPLSPGSPTGHLPMDILIHPNGKYAYVAVQDDVVFGQIELFDVRESDGALYDADLGTLTPRGTFQFFANPTALEITPDGSTLYVLHEGTSKVAVLSIDDGSQNANEAGFLQLESSQAVGLGARDMTLTTAIQ